MNVHQKIAITALSVMAMIYASPVNASEDVCTSATIELGIVTDSIEWIIAKTDWAAREPPSICFVGRDQLLKVYYGDRSASNDLQIRALYLARTHQVYLAENWNAADLHDRAALLHELVHHLQQLNNVKAPCLAANEPQAYHLEIEWVLDQGIKNPYEFLNIDEFTIRILSLCED